MKWILVMGIVFISGCGLRQREMEPNRKMQELNVKEQELALKEQSLSIKEEQLNEKEKSLDSTKNVVNDSLFVQHQKTSRNVDGRNAMHRNQLPWICGR